MAKQKNKNQDLTFVEFGKRVATIRKEIFKLKQIEFAPLIGTTQGILSRLELGIGGNMHILFDIVNLLNKNGLEGSTLFRESFELENVKGKKDKMLQVEAAEDDIKNAIEKLKSLLV